jgi:hypothetical protein
MSDPRETSIRHCIAAAAHNFSHDFEPQEAMRRWLALCDNGNASVDVESHLRAADRIIAMMIWLHAGQSVSSALGAERDAVAERLAKTKAEATAKAAERLGVKP